EVRASEKWLTVWEEENGQRPSAAARHHLNGVHVDLVDVGTLFAIDFDIHEITVHELSNGGVLKRFVLHDVAPVAGRVTDAQKDWAVFAVSPFERLRTPGIPIDGIVCVLQKIRTGFIDEAIRHRGLDSKRHT